MTALKEICLILVAMMVLLPGCAASTVKPHLTALEVVDGLTQWSAIGDSGNKLVTKALFMYQSGQLSAKKREAMTDLIQLFAYHRDAMDYVLASENMELFHYHKEKAEALLAAMEMLLFYDGS